MCGLRTRPRTDVDPPRFLPPSNCHRRGAYRLAAPGVIPCFGTLLGLVAHLWPWRGPPLVVLRYVITSGFTDDVIFAHSGPSRGASIPLQRVTSLRRRVQATAAAASYWLRHGERRLAPPRLDGGAGGETCYTPLPCGHISVADPAGVRVSRHPPFCLGALFRKGHILKTCRYGF